MAYDRKNGDFAKAITGRLIDTDQPIEALESLQAIESGQGGKVPGLLFRRAGLCQPLEPWIEHGTRQSVFLVRREQRRQGNLWLGGLPAESTTRPSMVAATAEHGDRAKTKTANPNQTTKKGRMRRPLETKGCASERRSLYYQGRDSRPVSRFSAPT
jgi:hypothetical protein